MKRWPTVIKKLSELKEAEYNPNEMSESDLKDLSKSLDRYGVAEDIVYNKRTGNIVGGHQRYKVLKNANVEEIEVKEVDLNDEDEQGLNLALNNHKGKLSDNKLAVLLQSLKEKDYDLDATGFKDIEINKLVESLKEPVEDTVEVGAYERAKTKTKIKTGDVYELGNHRLMCGDATKKEDVDKLMDGNKADMCFTDPPYGVDYSAKNVFLNSVTLGNRIEENILGDTKDVDMDKLWSGSFTNIRDCLKKGASFYITFSGDKLLLLLSILKEIGLKEKQILVWVKNNHVLGRSTYNYKHEFILYGWKEGAKHNYYGDFQTTVWNFDKPSTSKLHPTMKPVELISRSIKNSSNSSEIVLDMFGGSGSTLIACEQLDRNCYMMEIDPVYCQVIIDRWEKFTGKQSIKKG